MKLLQCWICWTGCGAAFCQRWLAPPVELLVRLYLAQVFFRAGLVKLDDWDSTLFLFREEYRVPLLPPEWAALSGTGAELLLPPLLALGLASRFAALGIFLLNLLAVWSYWHVLGLPEQAAGLNQHLLWGMLAALIMVHAPGKLSLDALLARGLAPCARRVG